MTGQPGPQPQVDVAIVGARVAGSALAARLAAGGLSVALFDRESPQQPTLSTHILHATAELRAEGVYQDVRALGVPELPEVNVRLQDVELRLRHPDDPGMCPPRHILDQVLLDRAVAAGAKAFTGTAVVGLLRDGRGGSGSLNGDGGGGDGPVRGVRVQHADASTGEVTARLVVGADGRNSSVARWVGSRQYLTCSSERSLLWRYFRGKELPRALYWHRIGDHIVSVLPTGREEYVVITQSPERDQARLFSDDPQVLLGHVEQVSPEVGELARGGEPAGPMQRIVRYPCYFRQPYGAGWALVGDAGHGKDATLGHGINDALRNTRSLAAVLLEHWSDPAALQRGLRRWARDRDRIEMPNYWYGQDIGRAVPINPTEAALLAGIKRSRRATRRLDDVMADRLNANRLLTPGRLVAAAARRLSQGEPVGVVTRETVALVGLDLARRRAVSRQDAAAPPRPAVLCE